MRAYTRIHTHLHTYIRARILLFNIYNINTNMRARISINIADIAWTLINFIVVSYLIHGEIIKLIAQNRHESIYQKIYTTVYPRNYAVTYILYNVIFSKYCVGIYPKTYILYNAICLVCYVNRSKNVDLSHSLQTILQQILQKTIKLL